MGMSEEYPIPTGGASATCRRAPNKGLQVREIIAELTKMENNGNPRLHLGSASANIRVSGENSLPGAKMNPTTDTATPAPTRSASWQGSKWCRPTTRLAIYLRDGLCCVWCGVGVEHGAVLSLDHLLAVSEGGGNEASNLVTCCKRCNFSRQDMSRRAWTRMHPAHTAPRVRGLVSRDLAPYRAQARQIIDERPEWLLSLRRRSSTAPQTRDGGE